MGAQTFGGTGDVHSNVAAAYNHNIFSGKIRRVSIAHRPQQLHRRQDSLGILSVDAKALEGVGADGQIYRVKIPAQLLQGDFLPDADPGLHLHTGGEDYIDIFLEVFFRQTVTGNAIAQHTAQLLPLFIYCDRMAHQLQEIRSGKAAGTTTHNRNLFAGGSVAGRGRHMARSVHSHPLNTADVDGVIHNASAASVFTGMLADQRAGAGKRIVLADQTDGIGVPSILDQRNISRDVHMSGTGPAAGNRLKLAKAFSGGDMGQKILSGAVQTGQNASGRIGSDGAVSRIHNGMGCTLQHIQVLHTSLSVQNLIHQFDHLVQAHTARNTFSAALRQTDTHQCRRLLHRAVPLRRSRITMCQILIQKIHRLLHFVCPNNLQSTHCVTSILSLSYGYAAVCHSVIDLHTLKLSKE